MASEWAKQEGAKLIDALEAVEHSAFYSTSKDYAIQALDAARAQGRREGLEEAARIAEKHADHADAGGDMRLDVCASTIAADIRARITQEPTA